MTTLPDWPGLMDGPTAAAYLSVSKATLDRITRDGDIPTVPLRSVARWSRIDLDAYIDRLRKSA